MTSVAAKVAKTAGKAAASAGSSASYKHLLSPLQLASGHVLKNRCIMGSMHTGLEDFGVVKSNPFTGRGGFSELASYFAERAKGGVALMVTGGISPNRAGKVSPMAGKMSNWAESTAHRDVTDAVHDEGGLICMQILHSGRYGYHPWTVAPSPIQAPIGWFKPRELAAGGGGWLDLRGTVESTIDDFVRCATLARAAGYDGVEVMGSEGYLLNQFLVEHTNHRTDEWGGSYPNRMKLAVTIVERMRKAVGKDFIIIFRLSMLDLVEQGSTWEEIVVLAKAIEAAGATIINTGIGWHEARVPTIATKVPRAGFTWVTQKMMGEVGIPLCTTNRINSPETADQVLADGKSDLVSMARPLLADPHFMKKAAEGRAQEINTCIGCNQACLDFTFKMMRASCLVNPTAGYELDMKEEPVAAGEAQRIAVVGAGPAGLAFATTAARRGHDVTLYDAAEQIGGQFNMAKKVPGKEEFYETLRYFSVKLDVDGVNVQLGTKVAVEDLVDYDSVVMATGVTPRALDIPGIEHPKVLNYVDVLRGEMPVGKKVAVVGAGGIGFDVAEYLTHDHRGAGTGVADKAAAAGTDVGGGGGGGGGKYGIDAVPPPPDVAEFMEKWGVDMKNEARGGLVEKGSWRSPRQVQLLQRKTSKHGAALGKTTGWIHRAGLNNTGVEMIGGVSYDSVDADGNLHITIKQKVKKGGAGAGAAVDTNDSGKEKKVAKPPKYTTESRVLEVDNIIICAGQVSLVELEAPLKAAGVTVFKIGGAQYAGELDANRAIDQGTRLALQVETAKSGDVFERPLGLAPQLLEKMRS